MVPFVTDHDSDKSSMDGSLPFALPLPVLQSHGIGFTKHVEGQTALKMSEDDTAACIPSLGSPFQSPKLSPNASPKVGAKVIQLDMSPEDDGRFASPANDDKFDHAPKKVRRWANPFKTPPVSDRSMNSYGTLVTTPQGLRKLSTDVSTPVMMEENVHRPSTPVANEGASQEVAVDTEMDIDQDAITTETNNSDSDTIVAQDAAQTSDADLVNETATESAPTDTSSHSVQPHVRPGFHTPPVHQHSFREAQESTLIPDGRRHHEVQRPYRRDMYRNNTHQYTPYRDFIDRDQAARHYATLMKVQNELNLERKQAITMRADIEAVQQAKTEAALSSMNSDVLKKQIAVHNKAAENEAWARALALRERKMEQMEVFFAEGQKQVHYQLELQGVRPWSAVEREHIRRVVELELKKASADEEARLATQHGSLHLREAMQTLREQQYQALVRGGGADMNGSSMPPMTQVQAQPHPQPQPPYLASTKAAEIARAEYNRGFAAGKASVTTSSTATANRALIEHERNQAWHAGYAASQRSVRALANLQHGRIDVHDPEVAFLFDAGHAGNGFSIGVRVGSLEHEGPTVTMGNGVENGVAANGGVDTDVDMDMDRSVQVGKEEVKKPAPIDPPTFASQLRGKQRMHNGHVVLAGYTAEKEEEGEQLIDLLG